MGDFENTRYAEAMFAVATAEDNAEDVANELFSFSQALQGNDELRAALEDRSIPVERRTQVVDDLLGSKASTATTALVSMVVSAGRANDLPGIIDKLVEMNASSGGRSIAEVRTAVPLNDDQRTRLAEALSQKSGRAIEIKEIVDPDIKGGVITQIGDEVIDGSVRRKLALLREAF